MGDLYRRMAEAVERVSERLQEDDNGKPLVFRDSMISNIRDLVDVVPRLNIFGDDELARLWSSVTVMSPDEAGRIGSRGTGTWNGARHLRAGILMRMASVHALLSDIGFLNFSSARETCVVSQDHRSMSMRTPQ